MGQSTSESGRFAWPHNLALGAIKWPNAIPEPHATIEFELSDVQSISEAVEEMKGRGYEFVHEARLEPWGQTVARLMSPEGVLVGLSYAPWIHEADARAESGVGKTSS